MPDDKEIFMRWTEVCKAFVNVHFQIRLNRSESVHPNFEPQFRTMVFLTLNKVGTTQTWKQEEYFYFYWISGNSFYPNKRKNKDQRRPSMESKRTKNSYGDTIASGSDVSITKETKRTPQHKKKSPLGTKALPPKPVIKSVKKRRTDKVDTPVLPSSGDADKKQSSSKFVHYKQAKPLRSEASTVMKQYDSDMKQVMQSDEAKIADKDSSKKVYRRRKKPKQLKHSSDQNHQPSKSVIAVVGKESEGQPTLKNSKHTPNLSRNRKNLNVR